MKNIDLKVRDEILNKIKESKSIPLVNEVLTNLKEIKDDIYVESMNDLIKRGLGTKSFVKFLYGEREFSGVVINSVSPRRKTISVMVDVHQLPEDVEKFWDDKTNKVLVEPFDITEITPFEKKVYAKKTNVKIVNNEEIVESDEEYTEKELESMLDDSDKE